LLTSSVLSAPIAPARVRRAAHPRARGLLAAVVVAAVPLPMSAQGHGREAVPDDPAVAIDSVFAFAGGAAPGCAVGVTRPGAPTLLRAYGMADLAHRVPNTPETVFESGSVAKQFTAAAVLLLAHDGRLTLDDDVRRHLPEVPDFGRPVTLRHLLTHTSGLREQWQLLAIAGNPPGTQVHTPATVLDLVSRQRALNFAPAPSSSTPTPATAWPRSSSSVRAGGRSRSSPRSACSGRSA
jgi:CubicO group peptidase (beta-lactamase class C family)